MHPVGRTPSNLSQRLRLGEIVPILDRAEYIFVVADGPLLRLPSHLLPVGSLRLGNIASVSSLPSSWTFALRRRFGAAAERTRSVYGIGDPSLCSVSCRLIDRPDTDHPHREVMCLGIPGGLTDLLNGAQTALGGC